MYLVPDPAWKFGCGRYVQKPGAILDLKDEAARAGSRALVLAGKNAWNAVQSLYPNALEGMEHVLCIHPGPCSREAAQAYAQEMQEKHLDVIVGIGGGKIMDLAKLTGEYARMPVINVPTICATCAAFTPLSVVYTPQGRALGSWFFENEIACLLVDTALLARQPARYAFSGIADSMAKIIEIGHNIQYTSRSVDMVFAQFTAQYLYDRLTSIALDLPGELAKGEPSPLIDELCYLTIAVTGMVSGCARGQGQSALAHGLYESVRTLFTQEAADWLHGEIVGVGLRLQLAYDQKDLTALDETMRRLGLPMHLRDIHVPETEEAYLAIAKEIAGMNLLSHEGDSQERVAEALKQIQF